MNGCCSRCVWMRNAALGRSRSNSAARSGWKEKRRTLVRAAEDRLRIRLTPIEPHLNQRTGQGQFRLPVIFLIDRTLVYAIPLGYPEKSPKEKNKDEVWVARRPIRRF